MSETYYGESVKATCADGVVRAATPRRYSYDGSMAAHLTVECDDCFAEAAYTIKAPYKPLGHSCLLHLLPLVVAATNGTEGGVTVSRIVREG